MKVKFLCFFSLFFVLFSFAQNEFLKVELRVEPKVLSRGGEAEIFMRIEPRGEVRVLLYPEFVIRFDEDQNFLFNKSFFTGNELNVETETVNQLTAFKFSEELRFGFTVSEKALLGTQVLSGEIIYTIMFKDGWSIKTSQKFSLPLAVVRERRTKK